MRLAEEGGLGIGHLKGGDRLGHLGLERPPRSWSEADLELHLKFAEALAEADRWGRPGRR